MAVVLGLLAARSALAAGASETAIRIDLVVAWSFAAAAAVALSRPALHRVGVLMAATSATWLLGYLQFASSPLLWSAGWLLAYLYLALLTQLVLSFPEGRVWSPSARLVVSATYAAVLGTQLLIGLYEPGQRNLLLVRPDQAVADGIAQVGNAIGLAIVIALDVLVVLRLIRLRGVARRVALPLLVAALLATPLFALRSVAGMQGDFELRDRLQQVDQATQILIPIGFFIGLAWSRLRRTRASTLVVELRKGGAETLRDRLARALGDPTLKVAYWLDESGGYVDEAGHPLELPPPGDRAVTTVLAAGAPVAALVHDPALLDEPDLIESVCATVGLVLENEQLAAEVREQLAEVRASRARIVAAADDERRRLERDLHDGAQQRLVGLSLKLRLAHAGTDPATTAALTRAQDDVEEALSELREFARGVHPSVLREDGLDAAVEALARRASVPVDVSGSVGMRLSDGVELAAYFFVSEALTNVSKHAEATRATVALGRDAAALMITVEDDGVGGADRSRGSGLAGLADRLAALDGTMVVEPVVPRGTRLVARIPCGS
ncbi:MAG: histidine kinase [Thermoleophilia bacterium]|nr:histidine kinase [Thermoleophilia bacterium]